ncbi:MAG: hypothetical protein ABEJ03_05100 [Candidatus Nanohaloarchaea archaeon]
MSVDKAIESLEEGDRILFNDKKQPLEVIDREAEQLEATGPQGGVYYIYTDGDALLVSKDESKRYSSLVENLRKTGRWKETENGWKHSRTGAMIRLEESETGTWTIETEGLESEIEQPGMGYLDREKAVEDVEDFIEDYPEG